jgi:hypothetical protein
MSAILPFKLPASDRVGPPAPRVEQDDVVVVILLLAGWLTLTMWLLGSIAHTSAAHLAH